MISAAAVLAKYWGIYLSAVFSTAGLEIAQSIEIGGFSLNWGPFFIVAVFTALLIAGACRSLSRRLPLSYQIHRGHT